MRFTDLMRRLLAVLALVAVAGCGRSAEDRLASDGTPSSAPTPVTTESAQPSAGPSVEASAATVNPLPTPRPSPTSRTTSSSPRPLPSPPHADPLVLTNADSGRSITVAVGTVIRVRLQPELGNYVPPTSTSSAVRREASSGGYPSNHPVDATFTAVAAGKADLSATTDAPCLHQQPSCMIPQKQWQVALVVNR